MKKYSFALAALGLSTAASAQLVLLDVLDSDIRVGETFFIDVIVEKDVVTPDAELLSFAFDVSNSATISYLGATVALPFSDDSGLIPYDVGGSVFPGLTDPSFTIATLSFKALSVASGSVTIMGPVDEFGGLKYTTFNPLAAPGTPFFLDEDFPIEAAVRFLIGEGDPTIPEPKSLGLLGFAFLVTLLVYRRRA